jgi:hypothetical protein
LASGCNGPHKCFANTAGLQKINPAKTVDCAIMPLCSRNPQRNHHRSRYLIVASVYKQRGEL